MELFERLLANAQKLRERAASLRAAARALLSHANATASAARVAVAMARNDLKRDRAVTFVAARNASQFSEDARRVLIEAFFEENQIEEPAAKAKAEAVLNSTKLASSILNEHQGRRAGRRTGPIEARRRAPAKHRHKQVKKPPKV